MSKYFVLSLPKSGTYMWSNILELMGCHFCGKHIAYSGYQVIPDEREPFFKDSMSFYQKSPLAESLALVNEGEFAVGHLPCTPEVIDLLNDFELIFSYRDLKDSLVSYVNYAARFDNNSEQRWADESLSGAKRLELFLRTDAVSYISLVNSVSGWRQHHANGRILMAEYLDVVSSNTDFVTRAANFFKTDESRMSEILHQAVEAPSFTKITNKLKTDDTWSALSLDYFRYCGLANINAGLGFGQPEIIASQCKVKKAAIICNPKFIDRKYVHDYLRAFEEFRGDHEVEYIPVKMMGETSQLYDFSSYSLVVVTFHIRPWLARWGNPEFEAALLRFQGAKVLLLHDEYDETNALKKWIRDVRINHVFSVIPAQYLDTVYPAGEFPDTRFHSILTAYVPSDIPDENSIPPVAMRSNDIVYRGRMAHPWLGELVREKYAIGEYFKSLDNDDLKMDLESHETERIYGEDWIRFLMSSRATLGTESGANVFDVDGLIRQWFESNPHNEAGPPQQIPEALDFREMNLGVKMNQISPKIFEAIFCKTALILYQGEYSGILKENQHYIELKKDHSNIDEVIGKLKDTDLLQNLVNRAYQDIVASGAYSYASVMNQIYGTDRLSALQYPVSADIYQKGTSINNLVNNQLAETSALLKSSGEKAQMFNQRINELKTKSDKRVANLKDTIEKLRARIKTLNMNNSQLQARNTELERIKKQMESQLLWKLKKQARKLIDRTRK